MKLDTFLHEPCLSVYLEARLAPDVFDLKIMFVQVEMVVCGEDCALTRCTVIKQPKHVKPKNLLPERMQFRSVL